MSETITTLLKQENKCVGLTHLHTRMQSYIIRSFALSWPHSCPLAIKIIIRAGRTSHTPLPSSMLTAQRTPSVLTQYRRRMSPALKMQLLRKTEQCRFFHLDEYRRARTIDYASPSLGASCCHSTKSDFQELPFSQSDWAHDWLPFPLAFLLASARVTHTGVMWESGRLLKIQLERGIWLCLKTRAIGLHSMWK